MKEIKIEHLAYLLKQAKENNQPQPIFFLGAGASHTGNIPLAAEIIEHILKNYSNSPFIQELPNEARTYSKLMDCLLPVQRDELLKGYVNKAKINVTHIYLAQLIKEGFVDYVLTVNFDNLMLRALALYSIFPATYDMAILKDLTTTTFKEKSVVYLHGQNHGLWLLNTPEEMDKVKTIVPRIFDSIKNKRPWVFIGYSGEDPIFEHIKNLGRFDNGLYWVSHNDNSPNQNVQKFLSAQNTNAFFIKGYDSDSFLLKLNSELGLVQPSIVDKPFTALKEMLNEIIDIDDKEHFKGVKERLEISRRQVEKAIQQYENGEIKLTKDIIKIAEIDLLKKEIINLLVNKDYQDKVISYIERRAKKIRDHNLQKLISLLYSDWGFNLGYIALSKEGNESEDLYLQAFEKYKKAIKISPDNHEAFGDWGSDLAALADMKEGKESENLYAQAFERYSKAIELNPDNYFVLSNWGENLGDLAKLKEGEEASKLYTQAFEKYSKAIEIKPDYYFALRDWGNNLGDLAKTKEGKDAEKLYTQAFEKYAKSIELKPDYYFALSTWGSNLADLAKTKAGKEADELYAQAFEKYQKAIAIKPINLEVFCYWGKDLGDLAKTKAGKEADELYAQAFEKYQKASEIEPNDHDVFNNWGIDLGDLAKTKVGKEADELYAQAFEKYQKAIAIKPDKNETYFNWGSDLADLAKTKGVNESEQLYSQAFEKYQKTIEIKPDFHDAYYNWGASLRDLATTKKGKEAENLYNQSYEKFHKAIELGGECYNLACLYAIKDNKNDALHYLDLSLNKKEILVRYVEKDDDWKIFLQETDFINILNKYRKQSTKA